MIFRKTGDFLQEKMEPWIKKRREEGKLKCLIVATRGGLNRGLINDAMVVEKTNFKFNTALCR